VASRQGVCIILTFFFHNQFEEEDNKMAKKDKDGLSCVFTPASGDAVIYNGKDPVVMGHGLKDTKSGFWNSLQTTVKAGDELVGTASVVGVGDPTKSTTAFEVFRMNSESMGCAVPALGINAVPAVTQTAPQAKPVAPASAPAIP
jgi:hypothetical protein